MRCWLSLLTLLCFEVTGLPASGEEDVAGWAHRIDLVLGENLRDWNREQAEPDRVELSPPIDDFAFARRAHLLILGRNPSLEELRGLFWDEAEARRASIDRDALVAELVASDEFNRQSWRRWVARFGLEPLPEAPAQAWLLEQLTKREPLATWMPEWIGTHAPKLLATGDPGEGAVDLVKVARWGEVLSGGQTMACAACHDHPFERTSREEVLGLAGYLNDLGFYRIRGSTPEADQWFPAGSSLAEGAPRIVGGRNLERVVGLSPWQPAGAARSFGDWWVNGNDPRGFDLAQVRRLWFQVFGAPLEDTPERFEEQNRLKEVLLSIWRETGREESSFLRALMASRIVDLEAVDGEVRASAWGKGVLVGSIRRDLNRDQRERSMRLLETGAPGESLVLVYDETPWEPEAAWIVSEEIERRVIRNPMGHLRGEQRQAPSFESAIELTFLAIEGRLPTAEERIAITPLLGAAGEDRQARLNRLTWALLMSEPFVRIP